MDVDRLEVIKINTMMKEERERHVRNKLCFICHKSGHRSKECPDRKYKGGSKSGKDKGKYKKKGKRFGNRCHIQATDMDDVSEEEEEEVKESHQSEEERLIRALKKLPKD